MKYICLMLLTAVLTACAGGGGGGSSSSNGNVTTTATGFSGQANWTSNGSGTVTSVGSYSQATTGLTYTETVNASNVVQSNSFTSAAGTTISFNRASGDTIANITAGPLANKSYLEQKADSSSIAIVTPASLNGWNYQSYGIWVTGYNGSAGTVGGGSAGTPTTGVAIPTSGTATFTGNSSGMYVNSSGQSYLTGSSLTATANFATRSIGFATTGTQALALNGGTSFIAASGLNMTGTLSYASASNLITGTVTTAGGGSIGSNVQTGTLTGKFYGPTATEVGGTFAVRTGGAVESYAGAFGAKR